MKPSLQFRLSQHLTLTPQLQQSIRLLQLSTVELNQEIDRLLMENPALEREDGEDGHEAPRAPQEAAPQSVEAPAAPEGDWPGSEASTDFNAEVASTWRGDNDEESDRSFSAPDLPTLRDHLIGQLSLLRVGERDRALVALLIDALDEDGYLTQPLGEIVALLPPQAEVDLEELSIALRHLQNLEPPGVGARSPGECLCLQLKTTPDEPARALALDIAEKHLELLASRDYTRLRALTGADDDALRAAQRLIQGLNPRPGAAFARIEARYVVPDVIVKKSRNAWRASLNPDAMPRLRINRLYAELGAGSRGGGAGLASQLQEARWLIKNVQQRFDTILRVSQAIVDRQRHFLEHGEVAMRPLVLREIAQTLGLHESTISRVTTQKFMATPRGTFELKYFFGSHVATDAGGAASSTAIRALIKQLVAAENPRAPLSDARIAQILGEQGIVVARRTIAKYRESLQIPPVNQRKAL
ncbi:MAG: RNA polymerase factor sigma-54 [Betaproteobacteria bacterium]